MPKRPLKREMRLRRQADFDRVHQANAYAADDVLVLRAARNEIGMTRLGVSISRKVGNSVVRNRWKRLIREAYRLDREKLPASLDLVARPRKGGVPSFAAIRRSLLNLASRVDRHLAKRS